MSVRPQLNLTPSLYHQVLQTTKANQMKPGEVIAVEAKLKDDTTEVPKVEDIVQVSIPDYLNVHYLPS